MSVRTQPGLITATMMPRGASCSARARIAMFTAALEVRYIIAVPEPTSAIEPMPLVSVTRLGAVGGGEAVGEGVEHAHRAHQC